MTDTTTYTTESPIVFIIVFILMLAIIFVPLFLFYKYFNKKAETRESIYQTHVDACLKMYPEQDALSQANRTNCMNQATQAEQASSREAGYEMGGIVAANVLGNVLANR